MIEATGTGRGRCRERIFNSEKNNDQQTDPAMRAECSVLMCRLHDAHLFQASVGDVLFHDGGPCYSAFSIGVNGMQPTGT